MTKAAERPGRTRTDWKRISTDKHGYDRTVFGRPHPRKRSVRRFFDFRGAPQDVFNYAPTFAHNLPQTAT